MELAGCGSGGGGLGRFSTPAGHITPDRGTLRRAPRRFPPPPLGSAGGCASLPRCIVCAIWRASWAARHICAGRRGGQEAVAAIGGRGGWQQREEAKPRGSCVHALAEQQFRAKHSCTGLLLPRKLFLRLDTFPYLAGE